MQALLFCSLVESPQGAMQLSSSALRSTGDTSLCDTAQLLFSCFPVVLVLGPMLCLITVYSQVSGDCPLGTSS